MLNRMKMASVGAALVLMALGVSTTPTHAQEDVLTRGTTGVGLLLRRLDGVKRVLVIGAHPDDEDTSLLAALSREMGVETAYLSLSRGEGGQNLIGEELDEGLGLVRTGELLAARALDGGHQFFSRAFDFGYSKTAEETLRYWPREEILADVTWVVRKFRPQVIVSVFSGTTRDGHGHHQVAGLMAQEVFRVAGDPTAFPEQFALGAEPWTPLKLYRLARFGPGDITTEVETGQFDPLLGRSSYQLAMESRSKHRSQDMGRPQPMGARTSRLALLESRVSQANGDDGSLFSGVDTTLTGLAAALPQELRSAGEAELATYRAELTEARGSFNALQPWGMTPQLMAGLGHLRTVRGWAQEGMEESGAKPNAGGKGELIRDLDGRIALLEEEVFRSAGVVVDVRLGDDLLVPGEEVEGVVEVWNGGNLPLTRVTAELEVPAGWEVARVDDPAGELAPGASATWRFSLRVPSDAPLSRPYFLERERDGELYRWPRDPSSWGEAGNPPLVQGVVTLETPKGERARVTHPAIFRGVDKATGEFVEPVLVVPALSLTLDPNSMVWPLGEERPRDFSVLVRGESASGDSGVLSLELPEGWRAEPESHRVTLPEAGDEASLHFRVSPPEHMKAGEYRIGARIRTDDGRSYDAGFSVVDYPHIRKAALFSRADARISVFPVAVKRELRVGYIMGSGDPGPEALRQMGVFVDLLSPSSVRGGDFQAFDVIVLGIRAYETRPDLVAANEQLLDFARRGGTLIVQYNKYEFPNGGFAPYPVEMARPHDRVTDETAPVIILDPDHPLFRTPNVITQEDFQGWAQERGLYFLHTWDPAYVPLLEMADPGESPKRGGLMVAPLGEGLYVYTGIAFFRQFPEGVPGAFRLFANLVSLTRADLGG